MLLRPHRYRQSMDSPRFLFHSSILFHLEMELKSFDAVVSSSQTIPSHYCITYSKEEDPALTLMCV